MTKGEVGTRVGVGRRQRYWKWAADEITPSSPGNIVLVSHNAALRPHKTSGKFYWCGRKNNFKKKQIKTELPTAATSPERTRHSGAPNSNLCTWHEPKQLELDKQVCVCFSWIYCRNLIPLIKLFFIRSGGRQEGCRQPGVCLASPHFILASCGGGIWGRLCWSRHTETEERWQLRGRYWEARPADPFSSLIFEMTRLLSFLSSFPFHSPLKLGRLHGHFTVTILQALPSKVWKNDTLWTAGANQVHPTLKVSGKWSFFFFPKISARKKLNTDNCQSHPVEGFTK